jgi:nucleoid-associated protein YgaU
MTEDKKRFSLFRKKEDEDQKAAEAKAEAAKELEDKKRREAARAKADADIRARHEEQMADAKEAIEAKVTKHVVASGESLSVIAKKYYDDAGKYMKIYEANKDVIGADPSLIQPGMELVIPK